MADYTITVSAYVNCFGGSPSSKWATNAAGSYTGTWGVTLWGEGTEDVPCDVENLISNTQAIDGGALSFDTVHLVEGTISVASETSSESLKTGSWNYVFVSDTTEAENRDITSWSETSDGSQSWTKSTPTAGNWS
jgi:hypothetical protein